MRRAVIYYSLSGNTKKYAADIAETIGADLIEVKLKKPMPSTRWKQYLAGGKQATFNEKPDIEKLPEDIDSYDEIIIGTPIWAGKTASPINTVLDYPVIEDKVTAVFTLSMSGNNTRCAARLKKKLPNLLVVISLTDMNEESSRDNSEKVKELVETVSNGKR